MERPFIKIALFLVVAGIGCHFASSFAAVTPTQMKLSFEQSQAFRSWFIRIVKDQVVKGASPRWSQKDCAGLVRFGVYEALRKHDQKWLKASGTSIRDLPPEVNLAGEQTLLLNRWNLSEGKGFASFVPAIGIIQENSEFVSKDLNQARIGDLLFFDQGEDQHLMIWMGSYVAYHTGSESKKDNGLRSVTLDQLMHWKDTRWQPRIENPNFIGVYRISFLSF